MGSHEMESEHSALAGSVRLVSGSDNRTHTGCYHSFQYLHHHLCRFPRISARNSGYDGVLDVYKSNGFGLNDANGDCFRVHMGSLNRNRAPMVTLTVLSRCI